MTVVRRTPYRNTVQNSQLRRKVTTLIMLLLRYNRRKGMEKVRKRIWHPDTLMRIVLACSMTSEGASLATLKNWRSPSRAQRMHAYARVRVSVCACVCLCVWAFKSVRTRVFVRVCIYVCVRACVCA